MRSYSIFLSQNNFLVVDCEAAILYIHVIHFLWMILEIQVIIEFPFPPEMIMGNELVEFLSSCRIHEPSFYFGYCRVFFMNALNQSLPASLMISLDL